MRTGSVISHYRVGDVLGQGGMGDVYRAEDTRLGRTVALKFLSRWYAADPDAKARFIREARAASALDHPNICTIHDIGETAEGELYLVMALYPGRTLQARLGKEPFDVARTVRIVRQVARALKRAHAAGIIHRDIKPGNVMVSDEDEVRLLDFGLAKLQASEKLTESGTALGTAAYMSPEQALAEPVTPAADVWSLGVMAYEILAGRLPFQGDQPLALLHQMLHSTPTPLAQLAPAVPAPLAAVVERALARDPAERYPSAAEFLDALDAAAGGGSDSGVPAPSGPAIESSRNRHRRVLVTALAMLVLLTAGGVALARWRQEAAGATAAEARRDVVAVLPFTVRGPPELGYLAEGLVDLVSGKLDGAGSLRAVDPRAVVGQVAGRDPATIDPSAAASLAGALGAGRFVAGQVVALPGRVSLSARLYDSDDPATEQPLVSVEGSPDSLYALVDQLATGLLAGSLSGANARIQRSAAQSSASLAATREFLRAEQFHRRGQFDSASAGYNRAIALDSTFALAHLMKSMNNAYTYDTDDYQAAVDANRWSASLSPRDRSLTTAFMDQQAGRLTRAAQEWKAHLRQYPDEVKALLQLGNLYLRGNARLGRPLEEARPYYSQVLALEPDNVPALHNLGRLDAAAGYGDSLQLRHEALMRVAPGSEWAIEVGMMSMFVRNDTAASRRFLETYAQHNLVERIYAVFEALRFSPDPTMGDRLLAVQRSQMLNNTTGLPDAVTIDADIFRQVYVMADLLGGRQEQVRRFLFDPARRRTATLDIYGGELVATGLIPVSPAQLAGLVAEVRAVDPVERLRTKFEPLHDIFTPAVAALERDVNLAVLLGMQGKFDEAWAIQRRLKALPQFRAWESLRDDAADGLAGELHYLQGDRRRALEVLRTLRFEVPQTANSLAITQGSRARFRRAQLEEELGDPEVARMFYLGMIGAFAPTDKYFLAECYEGLGRIAVKTGRHREEGIQYTGRLVRSWAGADAGLAPRRDAAAQRLAALQARPG